MLFTPAGKSELPLLRSALAAPAPAAPAPAAATAAVDAPRASEKYPLGNPRGFYIF